METSYENNKTMDKSMVEIQNLAVYTDVYKISWYLYLIYSSGILI